MLELYAILDAWSEYVDRAPSAVLATVVEVSGSAYRRPGARMLLTPDGRRIGSISGGCLEAEVARKAWWWTESGPVVRTWDTSSDENVVQELGLGCNGMVRVLLERPAEDTFAFLNELRRTRDVGAIATVIAGCDDIGRRTFIRWGAGPRPASGTQAASVGGDPGLYRTIASELLQARRSRVIRTHSSEIFLDVIAPPPAILIFGAGHDAPPLVRAASELGWHITVADGRPSYARPERFPGADRVVLTRPDNLLAGVRVRHDALAVVMNHSYAVDRTILAALLALDLPYIGMLGPRERTERMMRELGFAALPASMHAPVGLDIGADTPESIAVSIVAEMQAFLTCREGGKLRRRRAPIHGIDEEIPRAVCA